jgi:hypothetical protein
MLGLAGCVEEYTPSANFGERCEVTAQCSAGLVCLDRRCVNAPSLVGEGSGEAPSVADPLTRPDASPFPDPDLPPPPREDVFDPGDVPDLDEDISEPDVVDPDVPQVCQPGERECLDNQTVRVCEADGAGYRNEPCARDAFCEQGRCAQRRQCLDRDGDGFSAGPDCDPNAQLDCNDDNPQTSPASRELCDGLDNDCDGVIDDSLRRACSNRCGDGAEFCRAGQWQDCTAPQPTAEVCGDRRDNDCDGQTDEACQEGCVPDQCSADEVCLDGACQPAPLDRCLAQNQPCDPNIAGGSEFFCLDFSGFGQEGVCVGLCDLGADDPSATCPGSGGVCAFEADPNTNQGFCLGGCDVETQTGCYQGQGCVPAGEQGVCLPSGERELGEPCDANAGVGECADGLFCIPFDENNQGTCERFCFPLHEARNTPDICPDGQGCFAFSGDFGVCIGSLGLPEGAECERFDAGQLCDDDVVCAPAGRRRFECQRQCRLDQGDADCLGSGSCQPGRQGQDPNLGICR